MVFLHKLLGDLQFHFCGGMLSQLQNVGVLISWILLCEKKKMLLVVEKLQDRCKGRAKTNFDMLVGLW